MTVGLANELDADPGQLQHSKDLPVSDIFTSSELAMEYFIKGQLEIVIRNNLDSAIYFKKKAVREDPQFALAKFILGSTYFQNSDLENAEKTLDNTMNIVYKLPEKWQYFFKYLSYIIKEDAEKAIAVLNMWVDIFPDDVEPHEILAARYQYRGDFQASIREYETLLTLDAGQKHYYRYIGDLYLALVIRADIASKSLPAPFFSTPRRVG